MSPAPLVTAIVSTYAAERFIEGCLASLAAQTIFDEIEVLVIDSGSPQNEARIALAYAARHPNIRYVRTEREPLYVAWNRAIAMAKGRYLTSANADDRHHPRFFEIAATALEQVSGVGLVYSDQYRSPVENETFEQCEAAARPIRRWPAYTPLDLIHRCITGSQPMWRRDLHAELGGFDLRYKIAADYDMWLRVAERYALRHLGMTLGVLYEAADTISGTSNRHHLDLEILEIKKRYMSKPAWRNLADARPTVAGSLFTTGYRYIEREKDSRAAAPFIREAIRLHPGRLAYLKTYLLRCVI